MVEWKKMWEVTTWDKKFQGVDKSMQSKIIHYPYLLAKDLFALSIPNGDVKLLSTGTEEGWTTEQVAGEFLCKGEIVSIPWGKSPGAKNPVKYYNGKFVTGDNRIATSTNREVLNNRFLYYWMLKNSDLLETFYRGAGIQHPNMFSVLSMDIPILPISEQTRIVGILDTFTASIDNLKEQIAERRKQYEYYRDQLLDLEGKEGVEMKTLGELCELVTKQTGFDYSSKIKPSLLTNPQEGALPFLQTKNFSGRYFDYNTDYYVPDNIVEQFPKIVLNKQCLLFSIVGASIGNIGLFPGTRRCFLGGAICVLKFLEEINIHYVYEVMSSWYGQKQIREKTKGAGQATITVEDVRKFVIPYPNSGMQTKIVSILDTFEASIQNLEQQLVLREKQYEYYRNKLLTFE